MNHAMLRQRPCDSVKSHNLIPANFLFHSFQVHALYRTTGASFEKAQQEFATGVMSNKTVQTAAANAAANAASNAARGAFKAHP